MIVTDVQLDAIVRTLELHAEGSLKMAALLATLQARIYDLEARLDALEAPGGNVQ